MRRHLWLLPVAVLAAGFCFLTVARARDDDDKEKIAAAIKAEPDVQKLADAAASTNPDDLKKQADAIVKKYDELLPIMWQMKPRDRGGMGVGKPGAFDPDSIELQLLQMGARKPTPFKNITANAADYQRMIQVIRGIAAITPPYGKKGNFAKTPADEKVWNGLAEDMAKGADDLSAAITSNNANAYKTAVNNLNKSCNDCHTKFRDN